MKLMHLRCSSSRQPSELLRILISRPSLAKNNSLRKKLSSYREKSSSSILCLEVTKKRMRNKYSKIRD